MSPSTAKSAPPRPYAVELIGTRVTIDAVGFRVDLRKRVRGRDRAIVGVASVDRPLVYGRGAHRERGAR